MNFKNIHKELQKISGKATDYAIELHGPYKNENEFFGAVYEEYIEALEDMDKIKDIMRALTHDVRLKSVRSARLKPWLDQALITAAELIQVAACMQKMVRTNNKNGGSTDNE